MVISCSSVTGLATTNLSTLTGWQQAILFILMLCGSPVSARDQCLNASAPREIQPTLMTAFATCVHPRLQVSVSVVMIGVRR